MGLLKGLSIKWFQRFTGEHGRSAGGHRRGGNCDGTCDRDLAAWRLRENFLDILHLLDISGLFDSWKRFWPF